MALLQTLQNLIRDINAITDIDDTCLKNHVDILLLGNGFNHLCYQQTQPVHLFIFLQRDVFLHLDAGCFEAARLDQDIPLQLRALIDVQCIALRTASIALTWGVNFKILLTLTKASLWEALPDSTATQGVIERSDAESKASKEKRLI